MCLGNGEEDAEVGDLGEVVVVHAVGSGFG